MDIIYIDIGQKTGYHVSSWFHRKPNCTPRNCLFFISIKVRDELIPTLRSFVRELQIILHQQVPLLIGVGNFCPSLAKRHPFAKKKTTQMFKCSTAMFRPIANWQTSQSLRAFRKESQLAICSWSISLLAQQHSETKPQRKQGGNFATRLGNIQC